MVVRTQATDCWITAFVVALLEKVFERILCCNRRNLIDFFKGGLN